MEHTAEVSAPETVLYKPVGHAEQDKLEVRPAVALYLPTGQAPVQDADDDPPAPYRPAGQVVQNAIEDAAALLDHVPAAHSVHEVAPAAEYLPAGHAPVQVLAVSAVDAP